MQGRFFLILFFSVPAYPVASYILTNLPRKCRPAIALAQRIIAKEVASLRRSHTIGDVETHNYPPHISFARVVQDASIIKPEVLRAALKTVCATQRPVDVTQLFKGGRFELWPGRYHARGEVYSYYNCVWRLKLCPELAVLAARFEQMAKDMYGTEQPKEFVPHCTVMKIYCEALPPSFEDMLAYLSEKFPGNGVGNIVLDHVKVTAVDECMHVSFDD